MPRMKKEFSYLISVRTGLCSTECFQRKRKKFSLHCGGWQIKNDIKQITPAGDERSFSLMNFHGDSLTHEDWHHIRVGVNDENNRKTSQDVFWMWLESAATSKYRCLVLSRKAFNSALWGFQFHDVFSASHSYLPLPFSNHSCLLSVLYKSCQYSSTVCIMLNRFFSISC